MKLYPLLADLWKMDGGVAFGVVPKSIWNRNNMADENNMMPIVTRCLLVETAGRRILIDAGMGNKRDDKYYKVRYRDPEVSLMNSLKALGLSYSDITDVVFTHFHDDHVGGATLISNSGAIEPAFRNADFWCSQAQWEWAIHPNKREGASYFRDNLLPIMETGRLSFLDEKSVFLPGITFRMVNGHTMGQLIPFIEFGESKLVFMADFIPTVYNIPVPFVPSVDIQPLISLEEKTAFLEEAVNCRYRLFFEHDYFHECCTLTQSEKGIVPHQYFTISPEGYK